MKNKKLQSGFVLNSAFCDTCVFRIVGGGHPFQEGRKLHDLKEDVISLVRKIHKRSSPAACNGNLTVIYDTAVREI